MRKSIALLTGAVLAAPVAVLVPSAVAVSKDGIITDCYKTKYGETVRIRIRDEGASGRVRVSAPDGKGGFRNADVKRVVSGVRYSNAIDAHGSDPSYRTDTSRELSALATFKLRNGKTINMTCKMH